MSAQHGRKPDFDPTPPGRSRRHAPGEARQEITDAALRFLWQRPFRELTVAVLMDDTTLSRPSFYQYFPDLHALMESLLAEIEVAMHKAADPWIAGEGEAVAALRESLNGVVQTCVVHGPVFRAIVEAAPQDDRLEQAWAEFMGRWDDAVEARIIAQQVAGLIPPLDARSMACALNHLDASMLVSEFGRRPQGDPEQVFSTLHRIWVGALYAE
ncbi:hypothetical protein DRQ32_10365 [bacterium]|nr:MAG: hypothetical protein DRQ32_10365 [bacterium]